MEEDLAERVRALESALVDLVVILQAAAGTEFLVAAGDEEPAPLTARLDVLVSHLDDTLKELPGDLVRARRRGR